MLTRLEQELQKYANASRAIISARFFKTGKGQYGEGDVFIGLTVHQIRTIARSFVSLDFPSIKKLLEDVVHEKRQVALLILVEKFKRGDESEREKIFEFYLKNIQRVNNWDLVDLSADKIVGEFLLDKKREVLYQLAVSKNLWERRISIVSTFAFIRHNQFDDTLKIAEMLLTDKHDLIQKAVGWMLREVGKRDVRALKEFLRRHYRDMPRTMLRYAIEKFDEEVRKKYLKGEV
ncbi:MAG: hypothetical protein RL557_953 [archaeon]